ncbi:MAG: ATP-binding protein [Deltaproteobacteria bacterium]|nr:ATP-binding protein [Deltaproteobacteria bacterium]
MSALRKDQPRPTESPAALREKLLPDQMALLYSQIPVAVAGSFLCALAAVYLTRQSIPVSQLGWWLGANGGVLVWRTMLYILFYRWKPSPPDLNRWLVYFAVSIGVSGLMWSIPSIWFFPQLPLEGKVFIMFLAGGLSVSAVSTYSAMVWVPPLFYLPIGVSTVAGLFADGSQTGQVMGWVTAAFFGMLIVSGRNVHRSNIGALVLKLEKESLLTSLEKEKASAVGLNLTLNEEITQHRQTEEALRQSTKKLETAQNIAHLGSWEWDMLTNSVEWSDEAYRIYGRPLEEAITLQVFMGCVHPKDVDKVHMAIQAALEGREPYDLEHRVVHPDGRVIDVKAKGEVIFDESQTPYFMQGTVYDITLFKTVEAELRQAKDKADEASLAKSRFLAHMSHDLRTPLNSVMGFGQMLKKDPEFPLSPHQTESVDLILKAGKHLLTMIDGLLDLARIESGKAAIRMEEVNLNMLLDEMVLMTKPLVTQQDLTLEAPILEDRLPPVLADTTHLRQVLLNLLSNAVKYNRPQGHIRLEAALQENGLVRISVTDTGWGIPAKKTGELFLPFSRLGAERTGAEGTGIGLAISRSLVGQMGGQIGLESTVGQGTTFWVEFPPAVRSITGLQKKASNKTLF